MSNKSRTSKRIPTRKHRGQPGKIIRLERGFYSPQFEDQEILDLEALMAQDLENEIAMLRVVTRRVFELSQGNQDLDEMARVLNVLALTSTQLARLLEAQGLLGKEDRDEISRSIKTAIANVTKELKLN